MLVVLLLPAQLTQVSEKCYAYSSFITSISTDMLIEMLFFSWVDSFIDYALSLISLSSVLTLPTTQLCSHPHFGLCKHSSSFVECYWVNFDFFQREEFTNALVFMSGVILPNCHSASKNNYDLIGLRI